MRFLTELSKCIQAEKKLHIKRSSCDIYASKQPEFVKQKNTKVLAYQNSLLSKTFPVEKSCLI